MSGFKSFYTNVRYNISTKGYTFHNPPSRNSSESYCNSRSGSYGSALRCRLLYSFL